MHPKHVVVWDRDTTVHAMAMFQKYIICVLIRQPEILPSYANRTGVKRIFVWDISDGASNSSERFFSGGKQVGTIENSGNTAIVL